MGYYLQIDDGFEPLASIGGYGGVLTWAKKLPQSHCGELRHLFRYGWSDDVAAVTRQLTDALDNQPPTDPYVTETLRNMESLLVGAGDALVVTVTNGLGPTRTDADLPEETDESFDDDN